ncbi:hypothetical protein [Caenispirillum bisanense]|uniref:hypothetical protein n=1 Tax=Caenispirillum bisanense TaxID=414052 RepID=UPI0031E102D5
MPTEIRRLLFTEVEVARALSEFSLTSNTGVPQGAVLDFKIENEQPIRLRVHMQTREGKQIFHGLDEPFVAAALLAHCMKAKIPIARKSRKTVRVTKGGGIALDMTLDA